MNNLRDALPSKCFFPEPSFDVIQNFLVSGIALVQYVLELQVSCPKTIAKVLCKNPTAICVLSILSEWVIVK